MAKNKKYGPRATIYRPSNPEKYKGSIPIISRSKWETHAMRYFDKCSKCVSWGSESAVVRYYDPTKQKIRRYFIDFTVVFETKDGTQKKFYVEVKPYRQTLQPKATKRKKQRTFLNECQTYETNMAKWESARAWAKAKGATFIIITEKELFKDK